MKINVFTIRNKKDNSLIFAQGVDSIHNVSHFSLNQKWLTHEDLTIRNKSWEKHSNSFYFSEEIRHLFNYDYDLVNFSLEELEIN